MNFQTIMNGFQFTIETTIKAALGAGVGYIAGDIMGAHHHHEVSAKIGAITGFAMVIFDILTSRFKTENEKLYQEFQLAAVVILDIAAIVAYRSNIISGLAASVFITLFTLKIAADIRYKFWQPATTTV